MSIGKKVGLAAASAGVLLSSCGSRSPLEAQPLDLCDQEGLVVSCRNDCGEGQRICVDGHFQPCEIPVTSRACTNTCGAGTQTCRSGAWSLCDVPVASRACTNACGDGTQTCTANAWSACDVPATTLACTNACGSGT